MTDLKNPHSGSSIHLGEHCHLVLSDHSLARAWAVVHFLAYVLKIDSLREKEQNPVIMLRNLWGSIEEVVQPTEELFCFIHLGERLGSVITLLEPPMRILDIMESYFF